MRPCLMKKQHDSVAQVNYIKNLCTLCRKVRASPTVKEGLRGLCSCITACSDSNHLERSNETPAVLTMLEAAAKHAAMSITPGHLMAATIRSTTAWQMASVSLPVSCQNSCALSTTLALLPLTAHLTCQRERNWSHLHEHHS